MIIAIDPGSTASAFIVCEGEELKERGILPNEEMLAVITPRYDTVVIEGIASYGMAVGASVFTTCIWIGRFIQRAYPTPHRLIYRREVKMHLCHDSRAKDGNIRQAIIDRYPATGGGKCPQIGTKKKPGPLYGVSKDVWSALAIAIVWNETQSKQKESDK